MCFEAQVALARRAISPGSIDAALGSQTRAAIAAFQRLQKLSETASLDTNTRPALTLAAPLLTNYTVTTNDLARLQPLGKTWLAKSAADRAGLRNHIGTGRGKIAFASAADSEIESRE